MRKIRKILAVALALTMVMSLVAGCGSKEESSDAMMSVCIASEPQTIDPSLNSSMDGANYILHAFEGLMRFEPGDGDIAVAEEGVAEKVDISDDMLTYTFTLRDDAMWSDGEKVKSTDFAYAWKRLINPETASDYGAFINCVVNAEDINTGKMDVDELGIETPDDSTFIVHLVAPTAYFLDICAGAQLVPLREDVVEGNDTWTFDNYLGNGPYKVTGWTHDEVISMEKNDKYYDADKVTMDKIDWKLMTDQNAMLAGFTGGTLDVITDVPVDEIKSLLADETLKILPQLGTYAAVFNCEVEPFNDPMVREALSLAIDRNYICEKVVQTGVQPATAWVPAGIEETSSDGTISDFREMGGDYYSVDPADYEANCDKARELLAQAGFPDGEGFPAVTYLYNTSDAHQKIFEALENMWSTELGINVEGSNQDWNVFLKTRTDGDFQVARHGWIADFNDSINFLDMWTTTAIDGNNYCRWSNTDYDAMISDSISETDADARNKMLHESEDLMMNDSIVAPLYFYVDKACINKDLDGMYHTPLGYYFFKYCTMK